MRAIFSIISFLVCNIALAGPGFHTAIWNGATVGPNGFSSKAGIMGSGGFTAEAYFTGNMFGTLQLQVSNDPDGAQWVDLPDAGWNITAATTFRYNVDAIHDRLVRAKWTKGSSDHEITTLTIGAALIAGTQATATINGRAHTVTFTGSSDTTLQALRTAITLDPDVGTALVTVVGGNQTGSDDRTITISGVNNVALNLSSTATSSAGDTTVYLSTSTNAAAGLVSLWIQSAFGN